MKKLTLFWVTIAVNDFWRGSSWDFQVAAENTREARRLAVLAGEAEGLIVRTNIRTTDVSAMNRTIYVNL